MILNLALGLVFATQAPGATTAAELQSQPATDAAYSELASGRADEAVQRIESARADGTVTAAQLLNLGTAYAQLGRIDEARSAYRAVIAANEDMYLETSEGDWVESRTLARIALARLDGAESLAMR